MSAFDIKYITALIKPPPLPFPLKMTYTICVENANYSNNGIAYKDSTAPHKQTIYRYIIECMRTFGTMSHVETLHAPAPFGTTHKLIISFEEIYTTPLGNTLFAIIKNNQIATYGFNPCDYSNDVNIANYDQIIISPIQIQKG